VARHPRSLALVNFILRALLGLSNHRPPPPIIRNAALSIFAPLPPSLRLFHPPAHHHPSSSAIRQTKGHHDCDLTPAFALLSRVHFSAVPPTLQLSGPVLRPFSRPSERFVRLDRRALFFKSLFVCSVSSLLSALSPFCTTNHFVERCVCYGGCSIAPVRRGRHGHVASIRASARSLLELI
jgi:hypothetical protein